MVDLAGGGIKIGHAGAGTWDDSRHQCPADPEELVSHHTVRNCTIAHGGRLHPAAVGVWIGHSPHNTIEHNDIFDFYYTGISVGWIWGYGRSQAHHNDIGFNHIHTIGQGVLSDMGGIYTLGISPGTRGPRQPLPRHPVVRLRRLGPVHRRGLDASIVMENNLVYRTKTGGFHQHYGKENRIQNNIFAFATRAAAAADADRAAPLVLVRAEHRVLGQRQPAAGQQLERQQLPAGLQPLLERGRQAGHVPRQADAGPVREQRKQDLHSVIADPLFVDPAKGDFRLKPDSPALKLGFKPFDASAPAAPRRRC